MEYKEKSEEIEDKSISKDKRNVKEKLNLGLKFLNQKKVLNIIVIVLLLTILIGGTYIRVQNVSLLKDVTTDKYIPLALDPFYFLRVAETIVDSGSLPEIDSLRQPFLQIGFTYEILPNVIVGMYKIANVFGDYSLQYIDILYPAIFFILGLIVFFFLIYSITNSKLAAILSSAFLALIPSYLYRTLAGFSDHEAIGIFSLLLTFLVFVLGLKYLRKEESKFKKVLLWSILFGFCTTLSIVSWGGGAKFIFLIAPISFFFFWITQYKYPFKKQMQKGILFYFTWIFSIFIFGLLFLYPISSIFSNFIFSTNGLLSVFVLGFIILDFLISKYGKLIKKYKPKYRIIYSLITTILLGFAGLVLVGINPFSIVSQIWEKLLHPFGLGRVGLTVAENSQPYLTDWINQTGKRIFWLFCLGILLIGFEISRYLKKINQKVFFNLFWIFMVCGILFSRISATSIFNGTNFISKFFYILGILIFGIYFLNLYFKENFKISPELIFIASWAFIMIISGRGAVRMFFVLTPFVCFSSGFFISKIFEYFKKSKEELLKNILGVFLIILLLLSIVIFTSFWNSTLMQARSTGPSANYQWQKSMEWVRENIATDALFSHWWDYGYWIEYLGERSTIADGGHFQGAFRNHLIGRYLLTTPNPDSALSFMKSNNVTHLLIDSTDIGKYGAYSKIGSDESKDDRYSYLPTFISDPAETVETSNGMKILYRGGAYLDEDVVYNVDDKEIFFPENKAIVGGTILELSNNAKNIQSANIILIYNSQQFIIPIRYVYFKGKLWDFGQGIDSIIYPIARIESANGGFNKNDVGAIIYCSPKTSASLFVRLYLLNDSFNQYPTLKLIHSEEDPIIASLNLQGADLDEIIYYQGIRGPIKIWEVNYPSNILAKEEFLRIDGNYAEFDDLQFTK